MKFENINKYKPTSADCFFFDANVWIFLFCPLGNVEKQKQKDYSNFLQQIRITNATIFINSLVLSEFANRYLRLDFNLWKDDLRKKGDYEEKDYKKDYLNSNRYKSTIPSVVAGIKDIFRVTEKKPDDFHCISMENVLDNFQSLDFNDSYYIEFCKNSSLKLVTDDSDFSKSKNADKLIIIKRIP